jgi:hypothetical protein
MKRRSIVTIASVSQPQNENGRLRKQTALLQALNTGKIFAPQGFRKTASTQGRPPMPKSQTELARPPTAEASREAWRLLRGAVK